MSEATPATIGIEDHTGGIALEFSMNEAVLPVEPAVTSIVYRPPERRSEPANARRGTDEVNKRVHLAAGLAPDLFGVDC